MISVLHASAALPHGENSPGSHWTECWVCPSSVLDMLEKGEFLIVPEIESGFIVFQARPTVRWSVCHKTTFFFISICLSSTSFCASLREPIFKQGQTRRGLFSHKSTSNVKPSVPSRYFVRISDSHCFGLTIQFCKTIKTSYTIFPLYFSYFFLPLRKLM
jgi:hypothetical protein